MKVRTPCPNRVRLVTAEIELTIDSPTVPKSPISQLPALVVQCHSSSPGNYKNLPIIHFLPSDHGDEKFLDHFQFIPNLQFTDYQMNQSKHTDFSLFQPIAQVYNYIR